MRKIRKGCMRFKRSLHFFSSATLKTRLICGRKFNRIFMWYMVILWSMLKIFANPKIR